MAIDSSYVITALTGKGGASISVQYSADGSTWHDTFTDGDLYMHQKVGDGDWSNAIRIVGENGSNALVMTSATTPSGEYEGQVGIWQNQIYFWTNDEWVNQTPELPTDAVLHYSFDEVPDYPDGSAFNFYNKNFDTSDWLTNQATLSETDGILKASANANYAYAFIRQSNYTVGNLANKIVKAKVYIHSANTDSQSRLRVMGNDVLGQITIKTDKYDQWIDVCFYLSSGVVSNQWLGVIFPTASAENYWQMEVLYIGSGSYSTPIIDNVNGQNNAVNNGGLAIECVSGKGVYCPSTSTKILMGNRTMPNTRSVSFWLWLPATTWGSHKRICRLNLAEYYNLLTRSISFRTQNSNGQVSVVTVDVTNLLEQWLHIVVISAYTTEGGEKKVYIDGTLAGNQTTTNNFTDITDSNEWTLLNYSHISSSGALEGLRLDDFQIFDRALSEKEVLALYQAKGKTPKYFTLSDYNLNQIDDDNVISHLTEKPQLLSRWLEIYNAKNVSSALPTSNVSTNGEYKGVINTANEVGVISTEQLENYIQATNALRSALWGTNGYLVDMNTDSTLNGNLDSLFANYRETLQIARTQISQQQASIASALSVVNSNPFQLIPVDSQGEVITGGYDNTGTRLQVFNGTTILTPKSSSATLSNGEWKVTVNGSGIVTGSQTIGTGDNKYIDFGNVSNLTTETAVITYTINVMLNDTLNTIYVVQKFGKSKEGADGRIYTLLPDYTAVKKSADGSVLTPSSVTVQAKSWTGSSVPEPYNDGDLKAFENNVQVGTTVHGNSVTVTPTGDYPVVVNLYRHGTNTLLDTLTIPVLQEVKGDTGGIGATGQRGSRTFSGTEIPNILPSASAYSITTASVGIEADDMPIYVGDEYINSVTFDSWTCTTEGTPTTALWTYNGRLTSDKDSANAWRFFAEGTKTKYNVKQSTIQTTEESISGPFGETVTALKVLRPADVSESATSRLIPYCKTVKVDADNYTYRYSCYVKKDSSFNSNYFGIRGYESTNSVVRSLSGGSVTNAYHASSANNWGYLGEWMLVVGYITASGVSTAPEGSGVYRLSTKQKVANCNNYRFKEGITQFIHTGTLIEYHASTATPTEDQTSYVYDIRLDKCDGTEPSIDDLLNRDVSVKPAGNWASGTSYQKGDVVYYETNQCSYVCISPHTASSSILPTNTTYWNLVARTPVISASKSGGVTTVKSDDTTIATINDGTDAKYIEISATNGLAIVNGSPSTLPLSVTATGFTPTSYQWYKDDTAISGATSATYNATAKGVYKVVVNGTYTDRATVIEVNEGYSVSLSNENVNVPTDYSFIPLSTDSSSVVFTAYRGTTQLTATTGTVASGKFTVSTPSNSKFTITQSTAGTLTITPKTSAISGVTAFSIAINCEGKKTIYKTLSVSAVRTGDKGDTGVSITAVTEYYLRNNSSTAPTFSESTLSNWSTTALNPISTAQYLWNAERITKSDGTTTTYEYMTPHLAMKYTANGTSAITATLSATPVVVDCLPNGKIKTALSFTVPFFATQGANKIACTVTSINNKTVTTGSSLSTLIVDGLILKGNTAGSSGSSGSLSFTLSAGGTLGGTASTFNTVTLPVVITVGTDTYTSNLIITKNILTATLETSADSLHYTLRREGTTNYQEIEVTAKVKIGNEVRGISANTSTLLSGMSESKSVSSYSVTYTFKTASEGVAPNGFIEISVTSDGVVYKKQISVSSSKSGKYLGSLSSIPTADNANLGSFLMWGGTEGTYHQTYLYQYVCTASNTYSWAVDSSDQDTMTAFSDIMSMVDSASNQNVKAVALVQRLVAAEAFMHRLFAEKIQLVAKDENTPGAIYGGKYDENGNVNPNATSDKGVYMDSNGEFKCANGEFSGDIKTDDFVPSIDGYTNITTVKYQVIYDYTSQLQRSPLFETYAALSSWVATMSEDIHFIVRYYIAYFYQNEDKLVSIRSTGTGASISDGYYQTDTEEQESNVTFTLWDKSEIKIKQYSYIWVRDSSGTVYKLTAYSKASGYFLQKNGTVFFAGDCTIAGNSYLRGFISNNLMEVRPRSTDISDMTVISAGTLFLAQRKTSFTVFELNNIIGHYNGKAITKISVTATYIFPPSFDDSSMTFSCYNNDELVFEETLSYWDDGYEPEGTPQQTGEYGYYNFEAGSGRFSFSPKYDIYYLDVNTVGMIFKLKDLPTSDPSVVNQVYVDSNGFLKLSQ